MRWHSFEMLIVMLMMMADDITELGDDACR